MKGTLHKTQSGWQVWYHAKDDLYHGSIRVRILPLLQDDAAGLFIQDTDSINDGKEVEFKIVDKIIDLGRHGSTVVEKAKLVDNWLTMKEGDITVNFIPMPEFDEPISLLNSIRANPSWDTIIREFHLATQKVEMGAPPLIFECWLVDNYNPPTKK